MEDYTELGRFVTDQAGNRIAVIVDIKQYEALLEAFEDLEDIRAYDRAKASGEEAILFEQALREIEESRE